MMNWFAFIPELFFLFAAGVFLVLALVGKQPPRTLFTAALVLALVGVIVCLAGLHLKGALFVDTYQVDLFSQVFKTIVAMGFLFVICLCGSLVEIDDSRHPDFFFLLTLCTLSLMMLVSSVHLLTLYLSLEISSYSLYILVYLKKDRRTGVDAGIRYFMIGALASATMIFGMALIYARTGSGMLSHILQVLPALSSSPLAVIGLLLTFCGFFFKLALFPFHFWAPDVYAGAANQVTTYIATVSKAAAIAVLVRLAALTGGDSAYLAHCLVILAITSMTLGNLTAIVQRDFKRLLAYSSIAHAGYVMIGILCMNGPGYTSAVFYALALLLMKFACFMVVTLVAVDGRNLEVAGLAGLHQRSPLLALLLMMALFGLAGIPPPIGFTGKLLVFTAAMQNGYFVLILIAMFNVVLSLYYYLLVLKAAYLTEPAKQQAPIQLSPGLWSLAAALVAGIVVGGFYPRPLIEIAEATARLLF